SLANTEGARLANLEGPDSKGFPDKCWRAGAMGLEAAYHNPRAAVQAVFEQFPSVASANGPEQGTMSMLQNLNVVRGDMSKRAGWGHHDMVAWQTFFDKVHELGQIKTAVKAEDVCTNDCIGPANDF